MLFSFHACICDKNISLSLILLLFLSMFVQHPFVDELFYCGFCYHFIYIFTGFPGVDFQYSFSLQRKSQTFMDPTKKLKLIKIYHLSPHFPRFLCCKHWRKFNRIFYNERLSQEPSALCVNITRNITNSHILIRYLIANFMAIIGLVLECK